MKSVVTDPAAIEEILTRGVNDVAVAEHLRAQLASGKCLRIKFGIDPTSPHLHLGHTVPLRKLRQFQELGHQAVLIIGDATAMIGDPTGRSEERNRLTKEQVEENQKTYLAQAGKILDMETVEVHHNGEWFTPMSASEFLSITSLVTVQQIMQREDFRARLDDAEHPLSALEITYPILQGYDSVMVKADVEIGGHDQLLNLMMGRRLQRRYDMPEQDVLTVVLVEGTDGVHKMSKSFGNSIPLEANAEDMYGKVMMIPDGSIVKYFTLLTTVSTDELRKISKGLSSETLHPRDAKDRLAREIVGFFHGEQAATDAAERFVKMFREHEAPTEMPSLKIVSGAKLMDVLVEANIVTSKSDARRQIEQGAVKVDGKVVEDITAEVSPGSTIQKGKRYFVRLV